MSSSYCNKPYIFNYIAIILLFMAFIPIAGFSQENGPEEIVVNFDVPQLLSKDIFVQYDGKTIYLPLTEIFDLLDLPLDANFKARKFSGFIINKDRKFTLDLSASKARLANRELPLMASDYISTPIELFLRIDLFEEFFGLKMDFNFSALRVHLPLNQEFPSFQKLKRKQEHDKLQEKIIASKDIVALPHQRQYLDGGVIDWSLSASPFGGGGHYFDFNAGGMILGGDISLSGSGNSISGFDPNQMIYKWHCYFDHNLYLTQANLGDVNTNGVLSRNLKGVLLTNSPQVERKYFQTINVTGHIGEAWEVELYIDQKLTDFQTTDQTGDYNFNVDIYYGASVITLKMYGPGGEIRSEDRCIKIPYNLIPKREFQYTVAGGASATPGESRNYFQALSYYGVTDRLTIGANSDIPVNVHDAEKPAYAGQVTCQLGNNLTLDGSISPGYVWRGALNYSKLAFLNISTSYSRFQTDPFRNKLDQIHDAQLSLSSPLKIGSRYLGLRYNATWDKFHSSDYVNMNYGFSFALSRVQFNYMGKYKITLYGRSYTGDLTSQLLVSALSFPLVQPQVRVLYDHQNQRLNRYGVILNKRLFKTIQLSVSYEGNMAAKNNIIMGTLNFFTPFANFTSRVLSTNKNTSMSQMQRGSVRFDAEMGRLRFDRRSLVGFGSAVIKPFRDDNFNGIRDGNEAYIPRVRAKITGGREYSAGKNSIFYYDGLKPYEEYTVQVDQNSIDNPSLKSVHEGYHVSCNPNVVTSIEIPLVATSDISGLVERQTPEGKTGLGGIRIFVVNTKTEAVIDISAFSSGEYFYEGLVPGQYKAYVDPEQLTKYGYKSEPQSIEFEITPLDAGKSKNNMNFLLTPVSK
jgi:hypothetical protein